MDGRGESQANAVDCIWLGVTEIIQLFWPSAEIFNLEDK